MLTSHELTALLEQQEGPSLDWKRDFPPGLLQRADREQWEKGRGSLLKDLVAMANGAIESVTYLIYGVADSRGVRTVVGISQHWDDAMLQTWARSAIEPAVQFAYYEIACDGNRIVGVLEISPSNEWPHVAVRDVGDLHEGQVWYRTGTRNTIAHLPELRVLIAGEQPFKIGRLGDPALTKIVEHYRAIGREPEAARMSDRDSKLVSGYVPAFLPGTRREVWVGEVQGRYEHIMLLKPQSK